MRRRKRGNGVGEGRGGEGRGGEGRGGEGMGGEGREREGEWEGREVNRGRRGRAINNHVSTNVG